MILLLIAACGNTPPQNPSNQASSLETPDLPSVEQTWVQPTMTPQQVADAMSEALSTPPDPGAINTAYRFLMTQGDSVCPGNDENITDTWLYGCDAETGYSYAGVSSWIEEVPDEMPGMTLLQGVSGDFWIEDPDGQRLEGGGHSVEVASDSIWVGDMGGSWRWAGGDPWLSHGFSGSISMEFIPGLVAQMSGAADINGTHIAASELSLNASCDYGPSGSLSLRDPNGGWYTMHFTECDPCASVTFEGEEHGESCVDFTGFIQALQLRL
ncbi:MAG: hypothetical protein ACPGTU_01285 [Myxococcota bacterium]